MSHFIEENIYLLMAIINIVPILLLIVFAILGKIKSSPFIVFIKSIICDIILFVISLIIVLFIDLSLSMTVVLMLLLQLVYFPIIGIILLLLSMSTDTNWSINHWKKMLLTGLILLCLLIYSIIYIISH